MGVHQVVDVSKRISDVPEWFKGARLNYAENLLKHADQDKVALYAASKYILRWLKSCLMWSDMCDAVLHSERWLFWSPLGIKWQILTVVIPCG